MFKTVDILLPRVDNIYHGFKLIYYCILLNCLSNPFKYLAQWVQPRFLLVSFLLSFFVAFGCYDFVAVRLSAVLVTDARKCPQHCVEEREISVPYKSEGSLCFVKWEKLQYLDNYNDWKQLPFKDEIFTIDIRNQKTYLKV